MTSRLACAVCLVAACGTSPRELDATSVPAGGQPALPPAAPADGTTFATSERCDACHGPAGGVMRDAAGRDLSPGALYPASMMAWSARDPYWLAVWSGERLDHPGALAAIDDLCTRCHAPMGAREQAAAGAAIDFATVTTDPGPAGQLARDGVGCTTCHQLDPAGLGEPATYDGAFAIAPGRQLAGPHADPFPMPMRRHVNYTPVSAPHITTSELCASCHTVVTRALDADGRPIGPEFNEQTTYLEWRASGLARAGVTCQACHAPTTDADGNLIATKLSPMPPWLGPRSPIGRHLFGGANAYLLGLLADNQAWTGGRATAATLAAAADAAVAMGRTAAGLTITSAARVDGRVVADLRVTNLTGHKLPTGYPGRRLWLHVRVLDGAGAVVFESGQVDDRGHLLDGAGRRLDALGTILPHRDRVTAADQVALWEAVQVDRAGAPTHALLAAWAMGKDDRLLPMGWDPSVADGGRTVPVAVADDPDFGPGSDTVHLDVAAPGAARLEVALAFQSVPPAAIEAAVARATPAAITFGTMTARRPPTPIVLAEASAPL